MTKETSKKNSKLSVPIIVAIIGLIGICVTTIGTVIVGVFPGIKDLLDFGETEPKTIIFRVSDIQGIAIPNAKVTLLAGNDLTSPQYTDSSGFVKFTVDASKDLRVFVETNEYIILDQIIPNDSDNNIELRLTLKEVGKKKVIIRVLDSENSNPISGAEVSLYANGGIYNQVTDSKGITNFVVSFPTDEIDGEISVSFDGFDIERQKVTLQADRIQDINLDKSSGTLTVSLTDTQEIPVLSSPSDSVNPNLTTSILNINQTQYSRGDSKIEMIINSIELLPDNTMKLNLSFWNKSSESVKIGLDYSRVYLADEFGNKYGVLADSVSSNPAGSYIVSLDVGVKLDHSVIFPAPINGAKKFTVGMLTPRNCCYAEWNLFSLSLNYQSNSVITETESPSVAGSQFVEINQTQYGDNTKVEMTVRSVEILPDNTMRWDFSFWNKSNDDVNIGFDYSRVYLADEFGNRYEVLGDSFSSNTASGLVIPVEIGVRIDHSIIFPAPKNGAKKFTVGMLTPRNCCYIQWNLFSVTLNYQAEQSIVETPTLSTVGSELFEINQIQYGDDNKVEMLLNSVEILPDSTMRWNFSFWNKSFDEVKIGFDYSRVYLADENGNQYQVLSDSISSAPTDAIVFSVQPGVRIDHTIIFSSRQNGALTFTVGILTPRNCCYIQWNTFSVSLK